MNTLLKNSEYLLDLVSNRFCISCRLPLGYYNRIICRDCAENLLRERLTASLIPAAFASSVFSMDGQQESDVICRGGGVWAASSYRNLVREMIIRFKFYGDFEVLPYLRSLFFQRFRTLVSTFEPDLIVPVPMSLNHFLRRGTNLPLSLALYIGRRFEIPVMSLLKRTFLARQQSSLNKKERLKLSSETVKFRRKYKLCEKVVGKSVLLVDDVLTTGATVRACTEVLFKNGVNEVGVLVLAADP